MDIQRSNLIKPVFYGLILLVASGVVFYWFFGSDEGKIREMFREMEESGSKTASDTQLGLAAKVKKIRERFHDPCPVYFEESDRTRTFTRQDISANIFNRISRYDETSVSFRDLRVEMSDGNKADVHAFLYFKGILPGGEPVRDRYELLFRLYDSGEGFFIREITVMKAETQAP